MKKFLLFVTMLVFGIAGMANATSCIGLECVTQKSWTDDITFTPNILIPPAKLYYHDIGDGADGFSSAYDGGDDIIQSFILTVGVYDDNVGTKFLRWTFADGGESGLVSFGLIPHSLDITLGSNTYTGNFFGNVDLQDDGTLNILISSTGGDFYLASSHLEVKGCSTKAVPEPATTLLIGLGLAGLVGFNRKRLGKKD